MIPNSCEFYQVCDVGYYCDKEKTSEVDIRANMKCPAGYFCGKGLVRKEDAVECLKGHYCEEGNKKDEPLFRLFSI